MTNEEHNKYIGWAFLAHGAFQTLMMLLLFAFFAMIFTLPGRPGSPGPPVALFAAVFGFVFVIQFAFTLPSFIAAYGLFKKKHWARIATIVAGVLSGMNMPIGTAACVYGMWFFMGENWKSVYPEEGTLPKQDAREIQYGVESQQAAYEEEKRENRTFETIEPPDWR